LTSDNSRYSSLRRALGIITPFLLTAVFLYLSFYNVNLLETMDVISNSSLFFVAVYLVFFVLSHIARAVRWKVMIGSSRPDASVINLFAATMIGYGVNLVVPRLGELYRSFFAGKWEGLSRTAMLGTVIVERVIDIIVLGLSVLVSALIYSGDLYVEVSWLESAVVIGFIAMGVVVLLLALLIIFKDVFINYAVKIFSKISVRIAEKIKYVMSMLVQGFSSLKGYKNYLITIGFSALIMILYGFTGYLGFFVLNLHEVYDVTFSMAWVVMTVSAFGIVIPTPGGTGSYHFIAISTLVTLYGFTEEYASAYALFNHTTASVVFIILTIVMIYVVNWRRKKHGLSTENFFSVIKSNKDME
jgi:uncharacterized protein (TIRG00374 family)